jgi:hypothetical protein
MKKPKWTVDQHGEEWHIRSEAGIWHGKLIGNVFSAFCVDPYSGEESRHVSLRWSSGIWTPIDIGSESAHTLVRLVKMALAVKGLADATKANLAS